MKKLSGRLAEEARYREEVLRWEVDTSPDESVVYVHLPSKQIERYGLAAWTRRQRGEHAGMLVFDLRRPAERSRFEQLIEDSEEALKELALAGFQREPFEEDEDSCDTDEADDSFEDETEEELSDEDELGYFLDGLEEERLVLAGFEPYDPDE